MNKEEQGNTFEKEERKIRIEKQLALGVWIQSIGQIIELVSLVRLYSLDNDIAPYLEDQIVTGASIQTIGTILEAIGVTNEITEPKGEANLRAQKLALTGDWLQALGAALEAIGGTEALKENLQGGEYFIP